MPLPAVLQAAAGFLARSCFVSLSAWSGRPPDPACGAGAGAHPILVVLNPGVKGGCCGRWLVSWEGEGGPALVPVCQQD